ncbi:hypothetical protein SAMN05660909_01319 [Chitinophaga terrae (ex Kim and Jung 2007)]|uniref:Uncharacterized protein n=1 Tax=Chitinophaga terrae (ex Kim and Jung 2007) TaxID=408074 RepID=A0A1H3ZVD7_9BACT|nr:hypothetical protein [Chitinophaga terrae (ex Kim and Jung 2007)]GEP93125.1 hypothetical protein CTE07_47700 [Chitinophaga terrae (ex Kim and Jung 2007)]SEA27640.1 hypothetical protein SAMN05660909_01319 [Chitinophaga terrae (ex Kim and Jung 2007)]
MRIIDSTAFKRYIEEYNNYQEYSRQRFLRLKDAPSEGYNSEFKSPIEYMKLRKIAKDEYIDEISKSSNLNQLFLEDLDTALKNRNWFQLEILIDARDVVTDVDLRTQQELRILDFLCTYIKEKDDPKAFDFAEYLFEQVLDTAEHNVEGYSDIIIKLAKLNKPLDWYYNFRDQIIKLIYIAVINQKTLIAVRVLKEVLPDDMKEIIDEYIMDKYQGTNQ